MSEKTITENPVTRRTFVQAGAAVTAATTIAARSLSAEPLLQATGAAPVDHSKTEEAYRKQWTWDKKGRMTHMLNCTGACPHWVYVKDGVVMREEQSRDLPGFTGIPEYNPRGCNKGACGTDYMYAEHRIKYPLIRVGERGEGRWRRASWDEVLDLIGNKILDTIQNDGPDAVSVYTPVPAVSPVSFAAGHRFANLIGGHTYTFFDWYCDHPMGMTQTMGIQGDLAETADWYNAKTILIWGANPMTTRIPDAHTLTEARYNGTSVAVITPEYCSSAVHADEWHHPKPGTDAALANAMAHVIIRDKLYDTGFMKEQTDLPFLVRTDTGRFLRQVDLQKDGSEELFYCWDTKTKMPVQMRGSWGEKPKTKPPVEPTFFGRNTLSFEPGTIALGDLDPALEGTYTVKLANGKSVSVRPVFALLKEALAKDFTPAKASGITGIPVAAIESLAKRFGTAKPAMIIHGAGTNHWYHADVIVRAMLLLCALTGAIGKKGAGFNHYVGQWKPTALLGLAPIAFPKPKHKFMNSALWVYLHGEVYDSMEKIGFDSNKYVRESIEKGWMPVFPKGGKSPKVFICYRANFLTQSKGQEYTLRNLWPKLDLIVTADFRMSTQALWSDVVLPAAFWAEKLDLNMTEEHTFIQVNEATVPPSFESKTDWQIFRELSERVGQLAAKRGFTKFRDVVSDMERDLGTLAEQFTEKGRFATEEAVAQAILDVAPPTKGITVQQLREQGPQRFKANWTSPMVPDEPYVPFRFYTDQKKPWPTMTGRMQFYIDHPWFMELGQALPLHQPPLEADKYPLVYNTLHARFGMHSMWKDSKLMLRLERGGPLAWMNPKDAGSRGLVDNDWVDVFNDHGKVTCRVKIADGVQPGQVNLPFGPERYLDLREGNSQSPLPIRIKPTHIAGGYGHLVFKPNYYGPSGHNRDVRVEVRRYMGARSL
jgi:complex iron-sulfur molybdoenzyme family reductase subunit alpha